MRVKSTNQDCGETKPLTVGLIARGIEIVDDIEPGRIVQPLVRLATGFRNHFHHTTPRGAARSESEIAAIKTEIVRSANRDRMARDAS